MKDGLTPVGRAPAVEPLVRLSDLAEYRQGLATHLSGGMDDERWTAYRVRFGVYGQRQPGVQMVRIKIPGGIVPTPWLRTLARVNRSYAEGDAHITTRQDFQIYSVPLAMTGYLLEDLYINGITTREACGNTVRNITSCALSGACPREHVDAGRVAEQLSRAWIRHKLVQHMPRKVKITVSGCATDCGGSAIHDLAFIAVSKDGRQGFRVTAGGGLGPTPRLAVEVLDFALEEDLPTVVEALVRLHQRYSDRVNRNAARIKFVVKRFGEEKFKALFAAEFARLKGLAQRPWETLAWRKPTEAPIGRTPVGKVPAHDGTTSVVVYVPLGLLSSDQLDRLYEIAVAAGVTQLRTTRDQNLALLGVAKDQVEKVVGELKAIGLSVPDTADAVPDVVSCPGSTTCRIAITNSQSFAREVELASRDDALARSVSVHVSGCHNSCGLHHIADIGLHGMAKKLDGRSAPHYQLHIGGDARRGEIGLTGPLVPAKLADQAVGLIRSAWNDNRQDGEGVRAWGERIGKDGLTAVLAPLDGQDDDGMFVDWGDQNDFAGAPTARGECAAPFAPDAVLDDLADDALINLDRLSDVGRWPEALKAAEESTVFALRRLLGHRRVPNEDQTPAEAIYAAFRSHWGDRPEAIDALDSVLAERAIALGTGRIEAYREAVATLLDTVRAVIEQPAAPVATAVGNLAAILGAGE